MLNNAPCGEKQNGITPPSSPFTCSRMLPPEHDLELRSHLPAKPSSKPPLLFVHGGFCDGWCWEPYFLPWFASQGYPAHALSLRGHGSSGGAQSLFVAGLDDYAADVEHIASGLPSPPVLIGHSMGSAVVERLLSTRPVRAAALLSPVPPSGFGQTFGRLAAQQPEYMMRMANFDPAASNDILHAIRPMYFSDDVSPALLAKVSRHLGPESPRAMMDMTLRLHGGRAALDCKPLVLGAEADRVCTPNDVRATAALYGVEAIIVPRLAHMLMLEPEWRRPAQVLLDWLQASIVKKR